MKVRESGMPQEMSWKKYFNIELILNSFNIDKKKVKDLVEIGSGYGTFTIPISKNINGNLYAFDIENDMIKILNDKVFFYNIKNITTVHRDILADTTGLSKKSVDYVLFFNILHNKHPTRFLDEAYRILKVNGKVGILHWRSDIDTPRGPNLKVRPKPYEIIDIIDTTKFKIEKKTFLIPPYHYGIILKKI